jgi:uncharacterized protein YlxP (DUF503 family)
MSSPPVGVLVFELHIPEARSLKDKRHYVKGLKDRLRNRFNVSVAEIEDQDLLNRATLAAVCVSGSRAYAEGLLDRVEADAAGFLGPILIGVTREWLG